MSATNNNFYSERSIEAVFQKLVSSDDELKFFYNNLLGEYEDGFLDKRIYFRDMSRIAEVINAMFLLNLTKNFSNLFKNIEEILINSDQFIRELIVIGLFEYMQSTSEINYHTAFNEWLQPISKKNGTKQ